MIKVVLISDLHLMGSNPLCRIDDLTKTQFDKLEYLLKYCRDNHAFMVQAGDFFDSPRSWVCLGQTIDLLKKYKVQVYSIFGQHDTYAYNVERRKYTALGVLENIGLVKILAGEPFYFPNFDWNKWRLKIYGCSFGGEIPESNQRGNDHNLLVIHKSIGLAPIFPGHSYKDAKKFMEENRSYQLILCGDIHRSFYQEDRGYGQTIMNTGPMLRNRAEQYSFFHEPHFYELILDENVGTLDISKKSIPHKPPDEVISREHIKKAESKSVNLKEFTSTLTEGSKKISNFKSVFFDLCEEVNASALEVNAAKEIMEEIDGG